MYAALGGGGIPLKYTYRPFVHVVSIVNDFVHMRDGWTMTQWQVVRFALGNGGWGGSCIPKPKIYMKFTVWGDYCHFSEQQHKSRTLRRYKNSPRPCKNVSFWGASCQQQVLCSVSQRQLEFNGLV